MGIDEADNNQEGRENKEKINRKQYDPRVNRKWIDSSL